MLLTVGGALVALGLPAAGEGDAEPPDDHLVDAEGPDLGGNRYLAPQDDGQGHQQEREDADKRGSGAAGRCDVCSLPGTEGREVSLSVGHSTAWPWAVPSSFLSSC